MSPFEKSLFLVKSRTLADGGQIIARRYDPCCGHNDGPPCEQFHIYGRTLITIGPRDVQHLDWSANMAEGVEDLCDQLMYLLVRDIGLQPQTAESTIQVAFNRVQQARALLWAS